MSGKSKSSGWHVAGYRPVYMNVVVEGFSRDEVAEFVRTGKKPAGGKVIFQDESGDPEAPLQGIGVYISVSPEEFMARGRSPELVTCINGKLVYGDGREAAA